MKIKSLSYIVLSFFIFKNIGFSGIIKKGICELIAESKEKVPFEGCIPNYGCLKIPQSYSYDNSDVPLLYIRGIQDEASETKDLFKGRYNLGKLNQIVFATASSDVIISPKDIDCLKGLSKKNKINVASHSAGYKGLKENAAKLKGNVKTLFLLDNFYDPDGVKNSVSTIHPDDCFGFVTPHNLNRLNSARPNCQISQKNKDEHVTGVLSTLTAQNSKNLTTNSQVPQNIKSAKQADAPITQSMSHEDNSTSETAPTFSLDRNFQEYSKSLSEAQKAITNNNSEKNRDRFSALQEGVVDQYIHRSVQTLGCDNFKDTIFFNGARLAALGLKSDGNILLGDSKNHGLLSRLSYNIETWCRLSQKNEKESAYQNCVKSIYPDLEELSKYFFNFSQINQDLDSNGMYQKLKEESYKPESFLAKKVSSIQNKIKGNKPDFKCKTEEGLNPFAIKNEKVNPTGKYSSNPPRDSALKAKIIRSARETVKLSKKESDKERDALSVGNTSRGVFGMLRDKISRLFGSREGDEIDPSQLYPETLKNIGTKKKPKWVKSEYQDATSKKKCYRYTHIALASAGLTNRWQISGNGWARNATEEFIPNLKREDGSPYFSPLYPDEAKRKTWVRGDWGGGPQVRSPAANKLLMDNLNGDKQGVYLVVYDNPNKKSPGHIATIFYNEDKKQWEEYSDFMAPVQGYSTKKRYSGYFYGGIQKNTIRGIYKLNDSEAKN